MNQHKRNLVVFVEDEPLTRTIVEAALDDAKFDVLSAGDADEALAILERADGNVSAVLTDVSMPGSMDGLDLAEYVSHKWPAIGLLVTSGGSLDKAVPEGSRFIRKPYDLGHLMHEVREAISVS
jgi:DNA-binding NtrC family response regulator